MLHEKIRICYEDYEAWMTTYFWEESKELYPGQVRPVILICPGGAYRMTSDREAEAIAIRFMSMGYHTAVLRYSVAPAVYPTALCQLAKAVNILRKRSGEWLIDQDKILVMGFSAGGHLAASLGTLWNNGELAELLGLEAEDICPNGLILSYPVITSGKEGHEESFRNLLGDRYEERRDQMSLENQVSRDTPETFIWHTMEDTTVLPYNSICFVQALAKYGIPAEYHLFPEGYHGIGLGNELTANEDGRGIVRGCEEWSSLCEKWLNRRFPWWNPGI